METTYSITQQIESGKMLKLTDKEFRKKTLLKLDENGENYILLNIQSILYKYKPVLKKYMQKYKITDAEEKKYEYRPTILSYDLYGTIEFAPLILEINQMTSATEFCNLKDGIYLFAPGVVDALNEILDMEEDDLKRNEVEVKNDLASI